MADFLHNKLLQSLTSPSSRFPIFSFPLSLSPHSNFSTVRFIPPRWTRFSHSSVLAKLSPDSTQFDIISTSENSDGSVVFKFGDASEIRKSVENVDSRDANVEIPVSDTKSEFVGRSIDEFDDNDVKSVQPPGDECDLKHDVKDTKSEVVRTFDDDADVNDTKSEFVGRSDVKNDLTDVKEVLETAGDKHDVTDEKREVIGTLDGEIDARNEKSEIEGISDIELYARDEKSEVVGISDGGNDVNDTKSESVGLADVELDRNDEKEVLENAGDEFDAIIEKSEVKGTIDVSSEVVGTLDSGTLASNEISEIEGTSDSKNYVRDEKSDVVGTPGDNDVDDIKSQFFGRSDVKLDVNGAKEIVENAGDEFDAISEKLEVQGTNDVRSEVVGISDSGTDARYEKLEIEGAPGSKNYARVEKSEVAGTSDGDNDVDDPKSESVGRSDVELDLNDVKEVLESAGDEFDASDEKPEVQGTIDVRSEVVGTSDGGTDARNEKLEIQETPDSKDYARDDKLEVVGTPDDYVVVDDTNSEFVGLSDVELDLNDNVKEVLETSGGVYDASDEKPKGQGTIDVKSDVIGTSEGESDARNEKLEIQRTPDSKLYADDEKSEVVGTSGGGDDGNVENLELIENADGECDDKSEVVGSSDGEHDASSEKSVVIEDSVVGRDATDAKSEVLEASISECHIHDEKSTKVVSNNELYAHGAKSKVLETKDGENYVSDAASEPLGTSHGEHEMKLGTENISDAEPPKVKECHDTEVEHSINGKLDSEETIVESIVQVMELVGSMGITNESFPNSVADFQSAAQSDGDSNVLSDKGDSVELMPQPTHAGTKPITDEEANSLDNSVALESVLGAKMGNDVVPSTIAQPDDDPDVLKAVGSEASGVTLAETYIHSDKCVEVSPSELSISSAAVALSHPSEALTGGGDAYFVCQNWFGVADGVDQWSFEGITKGLYAQELMQNCEKLVSDSQNAGLTNIKEVLQQSVAMTQSTGSARVLIANFDNEVLHVANIGDSGFVIIRNGAVLKKSSPMVHEFNFPYTISRDDDPVEAAEEYHVELEDGDVVITATDGLFDNLYEQEIASIVSKSMRAGMEPKDIAELLAVKAQEVGDSASARSPFADAAQAAGHAGYIGGKLDHVTVVVSLLQIR